MIEKIKELHNQLNFYFQAKEFLIKGSIPRHLSINKVIFCGMGGSGTSAHVIFNYFQDQIKPKTYIIQDYTIPLKIIDESNIFIFSSYTGNTEETISCVQQILSNSFVKNNIEKIIVITSGGILQKIAKENNIPCILLPDGYLPREALGLSISSLIAILEYLSLAPSIDWDNEIKDTIQKINEELPAMENIGKVITHILLKSNPSAIKMPVIYCSPLLRGIALRWKQQINENSKHFAYFDIFPELHHNEIVAWEMQYAIHPILLLAKNESKKILQRIEITEQIFKEKEVMYSKIILPYNSLAGVIYGIMIGDFISYYLAKERKVDPIPVANIEKIKKYLANKQS